MSISLLIVALALSLLLPAGTTHAGTSSLQTWLRETPQALYAVALPLIAVTLVLWVLEGFLFGLPGFLVALLLMLFALDGPDPASWLQTRSDALQSGDVGELNELHAQLRPERQAQVDQPADADQPAAGLSDLMSGLSRSLCYLSYSRRFPALCYFLLLGPIGAVAYRLLQWRQQLCGDASGLLAVADWVPARLLAAACLVVGDFRAGLTTFSAALGDGDKAADELLADTVEASLSLVTATTPEPAAPGNAAARVALGQKMTRELRDQQALLGQAAMAWLLLLCVIVILD